MSGTALCRTCTVVGSEAWELVHSAVGLMALREGCGRRCRGAWHLRGAMPGHSERREPTLYITVSCHIERLGRVDGVTAAWYGAGGAMGNRPPGIGYGS